MCLSDEDGGEAADKKAEKGRRLGFLEVPYVFQNPVVLDFQNPCAFYTSAPYAFQNPVVLECADFVGAGPPRVAKPPLSRVGSIQLCGGSIRL